MKQILKAVNNELKNLYEEKMSDEAHIDRLQNQISLIKDERELLRKEVDKLKCEKHVLMQEIERLNENK